MSKNIEFIAKKKVRRDVLLLFYVADKVFVKPFPAVCFVFSCDRIKKKLATSTQKYPIIW